MSDMPKELTLRDYFAAMALSHIATSTNVQEYIDSDTKRAYMYADAMIENRLTPEQKELEKQRQELEDMREKFKMEKDLKWFEENLKERV